MLFATWNSPACRPCHPTISQRYLRGRLSASALQYHTNMTMASAPWPGCSPKTVCRTLVAALLALLLFTWFRAHISTVWPVKGAWHSAAATHHDSCSTAGSNQDNIGFVLKTGASEAFDKLPAQLETSLSCVRSLLNVADLDFEVNGYRVHDVLKNVSQDIRDGNPTFEIYHRQHRLYDDGFTLEQLRKPLDDRTSSQNAAWELDKFKFLPMVYKAYTDMPDKDWYVFLEADTYFNWKNLLS